MSLPAGATVSPLRAFSTTPAVITPRSLVDIGIARQERRARCFICRERRVLFRIGVRLSGAFVPEYTEARCAPCWGIRE